jgi:hypothetical protein
MCIRSFSNPPLFVLLLFTETRKLRQFFFTDSQLSIFVNTFLTIFLTE